MYNIFVLIQSWGTISFGLREVNYVADDSGGNIFLKCNFHEIEII